MSGWQTRKTDTFGSCRIQTKYDSIQLPIKYVFRVFLSCTQRSGRETDQGPQPLPQRVLHTVRSSASFFSFQDPLVSLKSSSCLRLFPHPPVTSILPCSSHTRRDQSNFPTFFVLFVEYYSVPWLLGLILLF